MLIHVQRDKYDFANDYDKNKNKKNKKQKEFQVLWLCQRERGKKAKCSKAWKKLLQIIPQRSDKNLTDCFHLHKL